MDGNPPQQFSGPAGREIPCRLVIFAVGTSADADSHPKPYAHAQALYGNTVPPSALCRGGIGLRGGDIRPGRSRPVCRRDGLSPAHTRRHHARDGQAGHQMPGRGDGAERLLRGHRHEHLRRSARRSRLDTHHAAGLPCPHHRFHQQPGRQCGSADCPRRRQHLHAPRRKHRSSHGGRRKRRSDARQVSEFHALHDACHGRGARPGSLGRTGRHGVAVAARPANSRGHGEPFDSRSRPC